MASALWPESSEEQARTNLRRELHALRRVLPEADRCLISDARQLGWNAEADVFLDVAACEADPLRYHGELLPGYYEEWLLDAREKVAQTWRRAVEARLQAGKEGARWSEALRLAELLVAGDPSGESAHQRVIRLHPAA